LQERAPATVEVILMGYAQRAAFSIACPTIATIGGVKPVLNNLPGMGFWTGVLGNFGVPVFGAAWVLRFLCPAIPQQAVEAPVNPLLEQLPQPSVAGGDTQFAPSPVSSLLTGSPDLRLSRRFLSGISNIKGPKG
jgi:hypothetical protein